jgi:outer membrane usher protein FimD/PapC
VWFHAKLIPTRWLSDSFGVVDVPQSGIKVLANNQYIASTGRRGIVILPQLIPYSQNAVRIDDEGVPIDLQINLEEKQIVPMPRTGVYVKFSAAKVKGALLILTTEDGIPVPLGAEVRSATGQCGRSRPARRSFRPGDRVARTSTRDMERSSMRGRRANRPGQ